MTHPHHPLYRREFEYVDYRHTWGEERVYFLDEKGQLRALPARWTDAVADDPFIAVSAGRAAFRFSDLLELAELIRRLR